MIATGLIAGIAFQLIEHPIWGVYYYLRNISVPVVLLYLLFQMRVLGAGDIKLFSMIGGILSIRELYRCMAFSFIAAGAGAVIWLAADKHRWERLRYAFLYLAGCLHTGRIKPYQPPYESQKNSFAFAVFILFGSALALYVSAARAL